MSLWCTKNRPSRSMSMPQTCTVGTRRSQQPVLQETSFDWNMQCWVLDLLMCLALIEKWWSSGYIRA